MPTIKLYSVQKGEEVDFDLDSDQNGEVVANRADNDGSDSDETLKFPAGLAKTQFQELVGEHNQANDGVKARDPKEVAAEEENKNKTNALLESLE